MATAEITSVMGVLIYDCCKHFVLFDGLCEKFWPSPRIEIDEPLLALCSLQNTEYFREFGAFDT